MTTTLPTIHMFDRHPDDRMREVEGKALPEGWEPTVLARKRARGEGGGQFLFDYLPGAIDSDLSERLWPLLSAIKIPTVQRATASGSFKRPLPQRLSGLTNEIMSATLGSTEGDAGGRNSYCRQTAFTKESGAALFADPAIREMFAIVAAAAAEHEPKRYEAQREYAERLLPDWRINETPWTTLTVNNNYSTGIHVDSGDLDAGVSCLLVLRRGDYDGAILTFPQWEIGVDLQDGDLLLMDAHQWHANTPMVMRSADAERVSVVFYLREGLLRCDTPEAEEAKHQAQVAAYNRRGAA